jgi:hypothetical protein
VILSYFCLHHTNEKLKRKEKKEKGLETIAKEN